MVNDVIAETMRRAGEAGVTSADDVGAAGRALAGFSAGLAADERRLKAFLHEKMYNAAPVAAVRVEAQRVLTGLWDTYAADPSLLPPDRRAAEGDRIAELRAIGDYLAGMTDRFAIRQYQAIVGPLALPEAF
jgi:dGTPase